jgi:hypothetical protein
MDTQTTQKIDFTRIDNDINGNPRYVCHFSELVSEKDREQIKATCHPFGYITDLYALAVRKANKIGGRKYHTKKYGGGIVFQSYSINQTEKAIIELREK